MARLIKPDGTDRVVLPKGKYFTLPELQALVGGYVEPINTGMPKGRTMLVDEDGRSKTLPTNAKASALVAAGCAHPADTVSILGNALIVEVVRTRHGGEMR